jgi:hypothetical protein
VAQGRKGGRPCAATVPLGKEDAGRDAAILRDLQRGVEPPTNVGGLRDGGQGRDGDATIAQRLRQLKRQGR